MDYVFAGGGGTSTAAVIVYENGSTDGFASLAGGTADYAIYKNGIPARAGDMRNTTWPPTRPPPTPSGCAIPVSPATMRTVRPIPANPPRSRWLGYEFNVLPSARQTVSQFRPGDQITLLLTEDNQVAGAVEATGSTATGNAIGIAEVSSGSATVDLLCGIQVKGSVSLSAGDVERLNGQLVRVSSNRKGGLSLTRLTGGVLRPAEHGDRQAGQPGAGGQCHHLPERRQRPHGRQPQSADPGEIPASQITYAGTDWADRVKVIVLNSAVASSEYTFGRARYSANYDEEGHPGGQRPAVRGVRRGEDHAHL